MGLRWDGCVRCVLIIRSTFPQIFSESFFHISFPGTFLAERFFSFPLILEETHENIGNWWAIHFCSGCVWKICKLSQGIHTKQRFINSQKSRNDICELSFTWDKNHPVKRRQSSSWIKWKFWWDAYHKIIKYNLPMWQWSQIAARSQGGKRPKNFSRPFGP